MKRTTIACLALLSATGSAVAQCHTQRLLSPDGVPGGSFGHGVVMNDRHLLITDAQAATLCPDPFGCSTGAVHAYEFIDDEWAFRQTIVPPDADWGDSFGIAIDADGDRLLVGSYHAQLAGTSAGGAYVYAFDGQDWNEVTRITPPEPMGLSGFGRTVALDGGVGVVTQRQGVYVFEEAEPQWMWVGKLTPPDGIPLTASFGTAILLSDDWLFIGAPSDRSREANGGSIYVYRRDGSDFTFTQKISPEDPSLAPRLGSALAFDGQSLFASGYTATATYEGQGVVYRYEFGGAAWALVEEITSDPPRDDAYFGADLSIADGLLVVGATRQRVGGGLGAAYVFRRQPDDTWSQVARLTPPTLSSGFGSTAIHDRWIVIGAYGEPDGDRTPGAAHVYDMGCNPCQADLDADGTLTIFDFLTFLNLFQDGDATADFDGDGELTIFDFLAFQTAFDAGCE